MRVVLILVWVMIAVACLLPLLRRFRLRAPRARHLAARDELVKDPVCQTYVVRSRAVSRSDDDGVRYFCSAECARRYGARG